MASHPLYIAGIGISQVNAAISNAVTHELAISAGAKALLDAGVTYDDVDHSVACFFDGDLKFSKSSFDTFGKTGASTSEVDCASGLFAASQTIKSGHSNCTLMIGFDKDSSLGHSFEATQGQISAIGIVLISARFLASHPYLKDSAATVCGSTVVRPIYSRSSGGSNSETLATKAAIRTALQQAGLAPEDIDIVNSRNEANTSLSGSGKSGGEGSEPLNLAGSTGLAGLCELVWQLRGWTRDRARLGVKTCLQCAVGPDGAAYVTILSRADGNPAPKWKDVEHLRDGRERVAHNPAVESKRISLEDWLAVKSRDEFVPEATRKRLALPVKGGDRAALARL